MPFCPHSIPKIRGTGLLAGLLLLGLSCSGPETTDSAPDRMYHVQLDMTKDKAEAERLLGQALDWWTEHRDTVAARPDVEADDSPVRIIWRAPLYRVRLGPFASRADAESVLSSAQSTFSEAFIAPDRPSSSSP